MRLLESITAALRGRTTDSELNDELRFHLEKEIELNVARGLGAEEARRQALIAFGGVQQARENVREVRWAHFLEVLGQDLRYAGRMLRKSPAFTAVAVLTLALGIGMNTAIFSVIDAVLFRSLPVRDPESLVVFKWEARQNPTTEGMVNFGDCNGEAIAAHPTGCSLPLPLLKQVQAQTNMFSGLAAWSAGGERVNLGGNGLAKQVRGEFVSGGYFETLGVKPAVGRMLAPADDHPEAPPVTVLSYKFWQTEFGGAPSVIGQSIRLNKQPSTIVGVAEPGFTALSMANEHDLWMPIANQKQLGALWMPELTPEGFFGYTMAGRVKAGVSRAQAEAAANVVFRNAMLQRAKPFFKQADDPHLGLMAAQKELRGNYGETLRPVYVLMLCVAVILLIACANVAGLLLARAAGREREIAVRLALGARRRRLLGQLLVESLILSLMGGALGLLTAVWGARALMLVLFSGGVEPPTFAPHLDWRVLAFTMSVTVLTGVVFGLAPASRALRVDPSPLLKADAAAGMGSRRFSLGNLLVAAQVALAVLVLATAGLLVRTLNNLKSMDPGFDSSNLLLFGVDPRNAGYKGPQVGRLYQELREKFAALPGVKSVSYSWVPLLGGGQMMTSFHKPGTPPDSKDYVNSDQLEVSPNFFATLRIPLKAGRDFSDADFAAMILKSAAKPGEVPWPAVVNQSFVRSFFPHQNPLGQFFGDAPADGAWAAFPGYQIVGVVADAKYNDLRKDIEPTIYTPVTDGDAFFELRTAADPSLLIPAVGNTINRVDANLAMFRVDTQKGQIDRQLSPDRMVAQLSSFFGLLALVLACMGLYGLLSYEVTRRTREIGIRMAVGARHGHVAGMVLGQGFLLAIAGGIVGALASLGVRRLVAGMLFGVKPGDPITLAASAALLLAVALAACYVPARRATRVDPLVALRYE